MRTALALMLILNLTISSHSFAAVTIENNDGQGYKVDTKSSGISSNSSVSAHQSDSSFCSGWSSCEITIDGGRSISAPDGSTVVIKNGTLSIK
jgi:hypothetical protein